MIRYSLKSRILEIIDEPVATTNARRNHAGWKTRAIANTDGNSENGRITAIDQRELSQMIERDRSTR